MAYPTWVRGAADALALGWTTEAGLHLLVELEIAPVGHLVKGYPRVGGSLILREV